MSSGRLRLELARAEYELAVQRVDVTVTALARGGALRPAVEALDDLELAACKLRLAMQLWKEKRVPVRGQT